jgi:hypothetical protein
MSGSEAAASPLRIGSKKEERTMNTKKIALIAGVAVVIAGGLLLAFKMGQSTSTTDVAGTIAAPTAQTTEINPFTHVASIPAIQDEDHHRRGALQGTAVPRSGWLELPDHDGS